MIITGILKNRKSINKLEKKNKTHDLIMKGFTCQLVGVFLSRLASLRGLSLRTCSQASLLPASFVALVLFLPRPWGSLGGRLPST